MAYIHVYKESGRTSQVSEAGAQTNAAYKDETFDGVTGETIPKMYYMSVTDNGKKYKTVQVKGEDTGSGGFATIEMSLDADPFGTPGTSDGNWTSSFLVLGLPTDDYLDPLEEVPFHVRIAVASSTNTINYEDVDFVTECIEYSV